MEKEIPRRTRSRLSDQGLLKRNEEAFPGENARESCLPLPPQYACDNGPDDELPFSPSSYRKGISPRSPAGRSPARSRIPSQSPRSDGHAIGDEYSARRMAWLRSNAQDYEMINERESQEGRNMWEWKKIKQEHENGMEMDTDNFHEDEDDEREAAAAAAAYHRTSLNGRLSMSGGEGRQMNHSRGLRDRSNGDQKQISFEETILNCINGRHSLLDAFDGVMGEGVAPETLRPNLSSEDPLIPELNQDGGYFQIGPRKSPEEESFVLSITIVFAKNLEQVWCLAFSSGIFLWRSFCCFKCVLYLMILLFCVFSCFVH